MKLRLRHNSVRLRLTQSEVQRLLTEGSVEESIDFGNASLVYALIRTADVSQITASMSGGRITIQVPDELGRTWASTDQVGIEAVQQIGDGRVLGILIEKDFKCLSPRAEDADAFEHPGTC